ncbi:MAG: hypothetical protein HY908_24330 [Myxococcales bacterium]|nr:hypothetical protein [Myxococcales bacterium]
MSRSRPLPGLTGVLALAGVLVAGSARAQDADPAEPEPPAPAAEPKPAASSGGAMLATEQGEEAEPLRLRYPPTSVRWGLIGAGAGLTLGAYAASLVAAYTATDVPGIDKLKIPVIGPWWTLGVSACPESDPECGAAVYLRGVGYVFDGLFQLAGLAIMAEGIFMTTEAEPTLPAPEVSVVPLASPTLAGLGVVGVF